MVEMMGRVTEANEKGFTVSIEGSCMIFRDGVGRGVIGVSKPLEEV